MTDDWITIRNEQLSAAVNPMGAELSSIRDADGRELMTDADPAFWTGRAPILFPVIGVVNRGVIRIDGQSYPMAKHGFARHTRFERVDDGGDSAACAFRLTDSAATREAYPFAFALTIRFALDGAALAVAAEIENRNDRAMPAQFGFHPAFAWPLPFGRPRADHHIVFERDEPERLLMIDPDGLIRPDRRANPLDDRTLHLADDLFTDDALVFDPVASQRVRYGADGAPQLEVAFPDTPRLGVWTKPGAAFVCIEPWHGLADPEGYTGNFRDKPGVFEVARGETRRIEMRIALIAA